jgi:hypothetical protein
MTEAPRPTKTIYVNGIVVGELELTGNAQTDLGLVQDFLKSKGLHREVTLVQAAFRQAFSFAKTAGHLYNNDLRKAPRYVPSIVPFVVNSAFSIELYLKTLHYLHQRKAWGHELLPLYDQLPMEIKTTITEKAKLHSQEWGIEPSAVEDFRGLMTDLNDAYDVWRYSHESGTTSKIRFAEMILVMKALDVTAREMGAA